MLLIEDPIKLHAFLDRLNDSVAKVGVHIVLRKCKLLLRDCISLKPNLVLPWDPGEVGRFGYVRSCISPNGSVSDNVFAQTE